MLSSSVPFVILLLSSCYPFVILLLTSCASPVQELFCQECVLCRGAGERGVLSVSLTLGQGDVLQVQGSLCIFHCFQYFSKLRYCVHCVLYYNSDTLFTIYFLYHRYCCAP